MKTVKRLVASLLLSVAIIAGAASAAHADYQTVVADWFYSRATCLARGYYLEMSTSSYYSPSCSQNSSGRWTLRMWVVTGVGGGGGGSWSIPAD